MAYQYIRPAGDVAGREHGDFLRFPLTNNDHLVSSAFWSTALDLARAGCRERGFLPQPQLTVYFRDLFFSRIYRSRRDFDRLWEELEPISQIGYRPATLGRAELGRQLTFGPFSRLVIYEQDEETIFSTNQSSSIEWETVVGGQFPHQPVIWQLPVADFLKFLRTVEATLSGDGRTLQARLNLDVLGDGFLVRARRVYHLRFTKVLIPAILGLGRDGERMLEADRKKVSNYQKIWFGDTATLKQMMCWQQTRVCGM